LTPCGLSFHRKSKKNEYGLNKKQQKRQFKKARKEVGFFDERYAELDEEKCGCLDKRKFIVNGTEYNSHIIIKLNEQQRDKVHISRKFRSQYMSFVAKDKGTPVKLLYIKYKNAKKWTLLLTADLLLSFVKAMELYQKRWSIEVIFKECKQYLRLGKAQNTDFYGQIADATITMLTYTILTLYKRFEDYETFGVLFRATQKEMLEKTLSARISIVFIKIVTELLEIHCLDVEESIRQIICAKSTNKGAIILLNAINQLDGDCENILNAA
jgi:hypothetical protein